MMRHGVDFGHCLRKRQNKWSESNTEFFAQFIDISASMTKPHSFSNWEANNAKQVCYTISNRYGQSRSSPTLDPSRNVYRAPLMV